MHDTHGPVHETPSPPASVSDAVAVVDEPVTGTVPTTAPSTTKVTVPASAGPFLIVFLGLIVTFSCADVFGRCFPEPNFSESAVVVGSSTRTLTLTNDVFHSVVVGVVIFNVCRPKTLNGPAVMSPAPFVIDPVAGTDAVP